MLAELESALDETLQRLTDMNNNDDNNLVRMIEEKLTTGLETRLKSLQDTLTASIEEKLKVCYNKMTSNSKSYAQIAGRNTIENPEEFRTILLSTRNEELVEERNRTARAGNIIIHGVDENGPENDKTFVYDLLKWIDAGEIKPKEISRIGEPKAAKKRPIIVTLRSEVNKNKVMLNLKHLKGKDSFKSRSVTEDYTVLERKMIQAKKTEVHAKNAQEPEDSEYIFKLHGTPKNGLQVRRFKKDKVQTVVSAKDMTLNGLSMSH